MKKIAVIGCGAWGTTIAKVLADNGHEVRLWCHNQQVAAHINETHLLGLLPGIVLPDSISAVSNLEEAVLGSDCVVLGVASPYIDVLVTIKPLLTGQPLLSIGKGMLENRGYHFISEYCLSILGDDYPYALISGPNLALEIASGLPAASVVASRDEEVAVFFQKCLSNDYFRIYTSTDVVGVETGGVFKNVIAIAAGCIEGLHLGHNALSFLISRALLEMMQLGEFFGARKETFMGLSGLGDLITTCTSPKSRNWKVGFALASHADLSKALESVPGVVAEGVKTSKLVYELAQKNGLTLPIFTEIYLMLYCQKSAKDVMRDLMRRPLREEF
jgi:glycerol-3-phosphate dehydrogenase (NAD(P)+)